MQISTKGRYAMRVMLDLALHSEEAPVPVGDISGRQEISFQYVEQLMVRLKKAGLVESVRGPRGGYGLKKSAKEITAGDIIRITEGPISPVFCISPDEFEREACPRTEMCATRVLWSRLGQKMVEVLDSTTLQELCEIAKELKRGNRK